MVDERNNVRHVSERLIKKVVFLIEEFKKMRNRVNYMVRKANKIPFQKIVTYGKNSSDSGMQLIPSPKGQKSKRYI